MVNVLASPYQKSTLKNGAQCDCVDDLDSSTLVKRYVSETGTAWIQEITDAQTGNELFIARITWVELRSALALWQREGSPTLAAVNQLIQTFRSDLNNQYQVIELDSTLAENYEQSNKLAPL